MLLKTSLKCGSGENIGGGEESDSQTTDGSSIEHWAVTVDESRTCVWITGKISLGMEETDGANI